MVSNFPTLRALVADGGPPFLGLCYAGGAPGGQRLALPMLGSREVESLRLPLLWPGQRRRCLHMPPFPAELNSRDRRPAHPELPRQVALPPLRDGGPSRARPGAATLGERARLELRAIMPSSMTRYYVTWLLTATATVAVLTVSTLMRWVFP